MFHICFRRALTALSLLMVASAFAGEPGEIDTSFGNNGDGRESIQFGASNALAYAATAAADGGIYIAGAEATSQENASAAIVRLSGDGRFDAGYGAVTITVPGYPLSAFTAIIEQPDGMQVAVGIASAGGTTRWLACRLLRNGAVDEAFGEAQTPGCTTPIAGQALAVGLQSNGHIIVSGTDPFGDPVRAVMLRLTPSGLVDTSFAGGKSIALLPQELSAQSSFDSVVLGSDDQIFLAGAYGQKGEQQYMAAKFTKDGENAPDFSDDGVRIIDYKLMPAGERLNLPNSIELLEDGSVVVSGRVFVPPSTPKIGVIKLTPSGERSPDFVSEDFPQGQLLVDPCLNKDDCLVWANTMRVLRDGRMVISAAANFGEWSIPALLSLRLLPNGQLDPTYSGNNNGEFKEGVSIASWDNFELNSMLLHGDRPVLIGSLKNTQDVFEFGAIRLLGDEMFSDGLEQIADP